MGRLILGDELFQLLALDKNIVTAAMDMQFHMGRRGPIIANEDNSVLQRIEHLPVRNIEALPQHRSGVTGSKPHQCLTGIENHSRAPQLYVLKATLQARNRSKTMRRQEMRPISLRTARGLDFTSRTTKGYEMKNDPSARFEIRANDENSFWSVYETESGDVVRVSDEKLDALKIDEAEDVVSLLNTGFVVDQA